MNTNLFGVHIEPDQIKTVGPLLLLLLIPLWKNCLVPLLQRFNIEISSLFCITLGGFSAVASFMCAAVLQVIIEKNKSNNKISAIYQFPQFLFLMLGEIWLSIPALEYVYTNAPTRMKSMMTALWFCNNAFGNLIVVFIVELNIVHNPASQFYMYAGLMLIAIVIFILFARNYAQHSLRTLMPTRELIDVENNSNGEIISSQL